ncbi:unnamed protein product [Camellia sinensis]
MAFENYCGGPDSSLNQSQGRSRDHHWFESARSLAYRWMYWLWDYFFSLVGVFGTIAMIGFLTRRVNQQRRWLDVCTTKSFVEHAVPALGECVTLHFKAIQFTNNSQPKNIGRADVSGSY